MKQVALWLSALLLLIVSTHARAAEIAVCKTADPFPYTAAGDVPCAKDIQSYMDRLNACTHFSGEEAYDDERAAFLKEKMEEFKCANIVCDYAALGALYEGDVYFSYIIHDYTEHVLGELPDTEHCRADSPGKATGDAD